MEDLSQRQVDILKVIIQEYTETGDPVGSEILEKKYKLGVSPATIRNEMVELTQKGYLKKNHFSSGRVPSAHGFRFYIKHLMREKELSTIDEVAYKNSIWDERNETHRLLSQATKVLAQRTGLLSLTVTGAGDLYYSGVSHLLDKQEFLNLDLSRNLFELLDELHYWNKVLIQCGKIDGEILYMLGEEDFNNPLLEPCACVFAEFETGSGKGIIGVLGPKRMYYETVTPQIRYFSNLIQEVLNTD
jgi:heat-inducible transcriptional repressor